MSAAPTPPGPPNGTEAAALGLPVEAMAETAGAPMGWSPLLARVATWLITLTPEEAAHLTVSALDGGGVELFVHGWHPHRVHAALEALGIPVEPVEVNTLPARSGKGPVEVRGYARGACLRGGLSLSAFTPLPKTTRHRWHPSHGPADSEAGRA